MLKAVVSAAKGVVTTAVAVEVLAHRKDIERRLSAGVEQVKEGYKQRRAERLEHE